MCVLLELTVFRPPQKKQLSQHPGGGDSKPALSADAASRARTVPRPNTCEEWAISARSRRVNGLYICEVSCCAGSNRGGGGSSNGREGSVLGDLPGSGGIVSKA